MSDSMVAKQYIVINDALQCLKDGDSTSDVVHNAVVMMQHNLSEVDTDGLEKLLLRIGSQNAKLTYGVSSRVVSETGRHSGVK